MSHMRLRNHYFLLRHGEPTWKYSEIIYPVGNKASVGLTIQGKRKIKVLAKTIKNQGINIIISSDFRRTRETAEIVARELNLKTRFDRRLRDQCLGVYAGRPKADYFKDFPVDPKKRFKMKPKGGESWQEVESRINSFLKDTKRRYQGEKILIVGHGDPLWFLQGKIRKLGHSKLLDLDFIKKRHIKVGEFRKIN